MHLSGLCRRVVNLGGTKKSKEVSRPTGLVMWPYLLICEGEASLPTAAFVWRGAALASTASGENADSCESRWSVRGWRRVDDDRDGLQNCHADTSASPIFSSNSIVKMSAA